MRVSPGAPKDVFRIVLSPLLTFILLLCFITNGLASDFTARWQPVKIRKKLLPGETSVKVVSFIITGHKKKLKKIRLCVKKSLHPFVSLSPQSIKKPVLGKKYPVEVTFSIPGDSLPAVIVGSVFIKVTKKNGKKQIINQRLKISLKIKRITGDLKVKNSNTYPTRIAHGPGDKLYVSDVEVGSVFIYDGQRNLVGELKNLARPLGVAVDTKGNIYVGNDGRDNIEVYSSSGVKQFVIENIKMPNDLALDIDGNLYVVDSPYHTVKVFNSTGQWIRNIGSAGENEGEFKFPVSVTVGCRTGNGEVYIADQGHAKVQVFDLQGNFLRAFGGRVPSFSSDWEGKFVRLQSLAIDKTGRLHAADCFMNNVQILDADTGDYINSYGEFGTEVGKLNLPLDISITEIGHVVVTNTGNKRVETIYVVE